MPKDEISNPRKAPAPTLAADDADDEVIDLLEVVKPGRKMKQDADSDDRDFGADLDAMLDGLSEAGGRSSPPHISDEPARFPDPTPVDHKVDHNETLDLPGMDDLDGLLKSLGDSSANDGAEQEAATPDIDPADLDLPDLDALPVPTAASPKTAAPVPPPAAEKKAAAKAIPPDPDDDDLLASLLAETQPAAEKADKPASTPDPDDDLFAELDLALGADDKIDSSSLGDDLLAAAAGHEQPAAKAAAPDSDNLNLDALAGLDSDLSGNGEPALADDDAIAAALEALAGKKAALDSAAPAAGMPEPGLADLPDLDDLPPLEIGKAPSEPEALDFPDPDAFEKLASAPAPAVAAAPDDDDGLDLEDRDPALPEAAISDPAELQPDPDQATPSAPGDGETPASRFDEVDLNELDALLDDMLATAPASGPGPAFAGAANGQSVNGQPAPDAPAEPEPVAPADAGMPEAAAAAAMRPDVAEAMQDRLEGQEHAMQEMRVQLAGQDAALKEHGGKIQGLQEEFAALSAEFGEQREQSAGCEAEVRDLAQRLAECGDRLLALEQGGETAPDEASAGAPAEDEDRLAEYGAEVQELVQRFSDSNDRMQGLENNLSEHLAEMQDLVQRFSASCDQVQALEQRLDTLAAASGNAGPAAQEAEPDALDGRIQQLEDQLAEQSARCQALETQVADLLANMDKLAAETAARVIREELAALMESMG